ncbi:MAG TPA: TonB-dependent receptor [Flavitalea sp.]|nr:TonB-dependent receptor [Flavitalea sp.]
MRSFWLLLLHVVPLYSISQVIPDTSVSSTLQPVTVTGIKIVRSTGHMPDVKDGIIYSGKKNEVIVIDSLDANKAINNTRQILGKIPGLNIVETENSGFTANGIATRGLNPTQSIEMNSRQNGYNISADIYGYNEAYYLPPMEAVSRIEMVRGGASLQFGSQFGGMINYVLNEAPKNRSFSFRTSQTAGTSGLFNSFHSVGGTLKKWNYYGYVQYRNLEGWRPNSGQKQVSAFGRIEFNPTEKLKSGVEYSLLRNRIQMPGGLTDSMFKADPRSSFRSRNWLKSPWNIVTVYTDYKMSASTSIKLKSSFLFSNRALVWRNEDGGAAAPDEIDSATGEYVPREVENENMHSASTEVRIMHNYLLGRSQNVLATGLRYTYAWFKRQGGGQGTTNTDFDLSVSGDYEYDLDYTTINVAPFIENTFNISKRFSVTPGFRFEYLKSTSAGYKFEEEDKLIAKESRNRYLPLFGIGLEYKISSKTNTYANFSQAYRPIDYSQLTPFGVTSRIDPDLKDATGFNADLGYRGTIDNFLNFDVGLFYLGYNKRIGTVLVNEGSDDEYTLRTNVANSVHKGFESYVEFNLLKCLKPGSKNGISIFNSLALTDARYTGSKFGGHRVEAATKYVNRVGISYSTPRLSGTFQISNVGDAYGDATNTKLSDDPAAGYIPAYTVMDFSASYKFRNFSFKGGINNIANKAYFTRRTDEYPGPGIIPSVGRMGYIGVSADF